MIETILSNIYLLSYVLCGLIYMKWEHDCFELDFKDCNKWVIFWFTVQQAIHYLRIAAIWPTYMIEDFAIYMTNSMSGWDDDEKGDDDDGII